MHGNFVAQIIGRGLARDMDIMLAEGMPGLLGIDSSPSASCATHWSLGKYLAENGVVFVFIDVVDSDMSGDAISRGACDHPSSRLLTVEDCRVADICVAGPGRTDKRTRASYAPARVASSRSCA